MRIQQVQATAFGPLSRQTLDFAPGMTVVHGPNEAGKSAWFAATYAALAGRRRAKGRGTVSQREFAQRHKPWTGSRWAVGGTFVLANDTVLTLEHNLRTGETTVVDSGSRGPITTAALERQLGLSLETEGGFDGARLLGLNRDALRAIAFVAQADVLRVVEDAKELQHLLERAASSVAVDVTADSALEVLRQLRSERVGAEHIGHRPLRSARQRVDRARLDVDAARDRHNEWVGLLEQGRRAMLDRAAAVAAFEVADRSFAWVELRQEAERLRGADALVAQLDELTTAADLDEGLVAEVRAALARYDHRGEHGGGEIESTEAADVTDDSAEALRALLAELPPMPVGDVEPRGVVRDAHQSVLAAAAAHRAHAESAPAPSPPIEAGADADRLRSIAAALEAPAPATDPALRGELAELQRQFAAAQQSHDAQRARHEEVRARVEASQAAYSQQLAAYRSAVTDFQAREVAWLETSARAAAVAPPSPSRRRAPVAAALVVVGVLLLVVGVGAGVATGWIVGGTLAAIGVAFALAGGVVRARVPQSVVAPSPPAVTVPPRPVAPEPPIAPDVELRAAPVAPVAPPRIVELAARIRIEGEQVAAADQHRQSVLGEVATLGLPSDPGRLRDLARQIDDAAAAEERAAEHTNRLGELARAWDDAVRGLGEALAQAGHETSLDLIPDTKRDGTEAAEAIRASALAAYDGYVTSCRTRADQAKQAARREDLESRLQDRLAADAKSEQAALARTDIENRTTALHRQILPMDGQSVEHPEAAAALHDWLVQTDADRKAAERRRELEARLAQVLEGRELAAWRDDLLRRQSAAGEDPGVAMTEAEVEARRDTVARLATTVGTLDGQARQTSESFAGLAHKVEEEAEAERELARVESLQRCLELAGNELQRAKEASQRSVAAPLAALMRPHLPRVTGGRYVDISIDPASLDMGARDVRGGTSDARLLSHGTTEQLYVLLRLALTEFLVSEGESAPFVLDDVTVQSDSVRTEGILDLLLEVSTHRQVILFTQEDEVVEWARRRLAEPRDRVTSLPSRS